MLATMLLIPPVRSLGYRLGIVDVPNARKVHAVPIPRVGGIAIIIGTSLSLFIWLELSPLVIGYLGGAGLIVLFGVLDDKLDLNFKIKLIVQIIAALAAALIGGVQIENFTILHYTIEPGPFFGPALSALFIVVCVNAVNFADGLDGLAGGISLLSLAVLAIFAYRAQSTEVLLISVAVGGAVLGFLLFNNHPAQIFMGDGGSQFLGYTLAVLSIYLTQSVDTSLSSFLPLLIIGIPLVDFLYVIVIRLLNGNSPFQPDKNHIHHRLMQAGLYQYGSVFVIYLLQAIILSVALAVRREDDTISLFLFFAAIAFSTTIVLALDRLQKAGITARFMSHHPGALPPQAIPEFITNIAGLFVLTTVPIYLVTSAVFVLDTPNGVTNVVRLLLLMSVVLLFLPINNKFIVWLLRYILYSTVLAVLFFSYTTESWLPTYKLIISSYFLLLAIAVLIAIRYSKLPGLTIKPIDVLIVTGALLLPAFDGVFNDDPILWFFVPHLLVMFYSLEYIVQTAGHYDKYRWLVLVNIIPLAILTFKALN
ncbi:MAG: MraY family glycosyltransferase [Thiotrichales bacterium]